jgi:hypothetical protein
MPALTTPTPTPAAAPANTALFAKPGESILDYETRLGSTNKSNPSIGTGFGTPQPVAKTLVPPAQGGTQGQPDSSDPLGSAQDKAAIAAGYTSYADAVSKLTAPSEDTTTFYNDAYTAAGLDKLQQQINQKNSDLNTALGTVNDDPWLDEADRVGRAKNLQTLAQGDIKNLTDQYNAGLKNVNTLVSNHSKDISANDASNKAKLAFLEAQAKAQAAQTTAQQKTENTPPKTIRGANGATFQWDPTTGQFNQILPGKSGAGSTSTADAVSSMSNEIEGLLGTPGYSTDGYISPNDWDTALKAWNSQGLSTASFISNFKRYANPNDTYTGVTKTKSSSAPATTVIPGISLGGSTQAFA